MTRDLFADAEQGGSSREALCPGAVVLRRFALALEADLLAAIEDIAAAAPFRHMATPGGFRMSVAMTHCGGYGWVTDETGYRYAALDPVSNKPWPGMPAVFVKLARDAAAEAGFTNFTPDACLVNRYEPGARMSLHQDRNERDLTQPIVSVSLGLPAVFLFGGLQRNGKPVRVLLLHGDVVVWGGPARLRYHGVLALKPGQHALMGECRFNLTFRKAK